VVWLAIRRARNVREVRALADCAPELTLCAIIRV
jgi:hypothetical protein